MPWLQISVFPNLPRIGHGERFLRDDFHGRQSGPEVAKCHPPGQVPSSRRTGETVVFTFRHRQNNCSKPYTWNYDPSRIRQSAGEILPQANNTAKNALFVDSPDWVELYSTPSGSVLNPPNMRVEPAFSSFIASVYYYSSLSIVAVTR